MRIRRGLLGVAAGAVMAITAGGMTALPARPALAGSFTNLRLPTGFSGGVDTEPSIKVGPDGTAYIGAIRGVPSGMDMWKVPAGASTATYLGSPDSLVPGNTICCAAIGGGDMDLAINNDGTVVYSSLWLGSITVGQSTNGGSSFISQPLGSVIVGDDRMWNTSDGSNVYMSFHDLATGNIDVEKSPAGPAAGLVYAPTGAGVFSPTAVPSNELGNLLADRLHSGVLYQPFTQSANGSSSHNQLDVAVSTDGGSSWTQHAVFTQPAGSDLDSDFPAIAEDHAGNLYAVASDNTHVLVSSSTNGGATWSAPTNVNASGNAAVFPWIAAGGAGGAVVTWYQGTTTNPSNSANSWTVQSAESTNANTAAPTYAVAQVSSGAVRQGVICEGGLGCSDGRQLGDFFQVAVGPNGLASVAWTDDGSGGGAAGDYYGTGGINLGAP